MTSHASSRVAGTPVSSARALDAWPAGRRWLLAAPALAAVAMIIALSAAGGAPQPEAAGLPDPGPITGWGLPLVRLVFDLAAVAVIGALVTALLLPQKDYAAVPDPSTSVAARAMRAATWSAYAWVGSTAILVFLTVSDILAVPPGTVLTSTRLWAFAWDLAPARGLLFVLAGGLLLAAYAGWTRTRGGAAALLAIAVGTLLPVLFAGHSAAATDHDLATSSLVVHVIGASVWVGGLVGVLVLLRRTPPTLAAVLPRYSTLAFICFAAVAASGLLNAWVRTSGDLALWADSGYGALLVVKFTGLVALGCFGWFHRRRTLGHLADGRPGAFARLATGEVMVMAATIGVAVALSRTPPPAGGTVNIPSHGSGHATLATDVAPFALFRIFTDWRPEAISLAVVAIAFGCYLCGLRSLRRTGAQWPVQRTVAAVAAAVVALLTTSGGLAAYSTATFSLQVAQFLVLLVVVPVLVCLSAPVTMVVQIRRSQNPAAEDDPDWLPDVLRSRAVGWLSDPLNGLILATALVFALYATPLLVDSLRSAPLHLTVNLLTLAVGYVFWRAVLGTDPLPAPRPLAYRLWVLLGFLLLLAGVGARIFLSDVLLAGAWFTDLDWEWVDVTSDQRLGAEMMWAAVLVFGPVLALLIRRVDREVRSAA